MESRQISIQMDMIVRKDSTSRDQFLKQHVRRKEIHSSAKQTKERKVIFTLEKIPEGS